MRVDVGNGQTVPAQRDITIRDCLLHSAGFGYSVGLGGQGGFQPGNMMGLLKLPFTSLNQFIAELSRKPLLFQPGECRRHMMTDYHARQSGWADQTDLHISSR
jgi:CubicO group peptidase (beta-lactamase class C family)